jgi:hypothetical protein
MNYTALLRRAGAAAKPPPRLPAWCFQYYSFSREEEDFCPFLGQGDIIEIL